MISKARSSEFQVSGEDKEHEERSAKQSPQERSASNKFPSQGYCKYKNDEGAHEKPFYEHGAGSLRSRIRSVGIIQ
jgi:hypothetical protein